MTVVKGIGIDIVALDRFVRVREQGSMLEQVFTPEELQEIRDRRDADEEQARRFTLKEATFKALTTGLHYGSYWHCVTATGEENVEISGALRQRMGNNPRVFVASTSTKRWAVGLALIQEE